MAGKRKLTPEQEKEIKMLQASNEMYERTKEDAAIRGNKEGIVRIEIAQEEVKEKIRKIMGDDETNVEIPQNKIKPISVETNENKAIDFLLNNSEMPDDNSIYDILENHKKDEEEKIAKHKRRGTETDIETENKIKYGEEIVNPSETTFNNVDSQAQYDVISLPSNGECYKSKISRVPVSYLTAYDENIITSPNLYRDGLVIDYLIKNKVVNKDINVEELVSGDVDAIVLFLRATSYGVEFPVVVTDPETDEEIETNIDLSKIKPKEFTLKGDENGHFSYTLPNSGVEVKFKYLTRKEENDLRLLTRIESEGTAVLDLRDANKTINSILKADTVLEPKEKGAILDATRKIEDWAKRIENKNSTKFNKSITNRLEMQIVAINGNYDREYIRKAIYNMPANDSLKLRRYIINNEPGLDFEVEIERPESLGGGSFKTFLEWNDTLFYNIAG